MAPHYPEIIDNDTFLDLVIQKKTPALICFLSEWSAPCREMKPVIEQADNCFYGKLRMFVADPDESPLLAASCSISSIPTLLLFVDGAETGKIVGVRSFEDVEKMIVHGIDSTV